MIEFKGFLSFIILHELKQKQQSGDELAVRIGKRKGSTLTPGTIYPTLKRLRKMKLVFFRRAGRKKMYALTDQGSVELKRQYSLFSRYFYGFKGLIQRPKKQTVQKQPRQKKVQSEQEKKPDTAVQTAVQKSALNTSNKEKKEQFVPIASTKIKNISVKKKSVKKSSETNGVALPEKAPSKLEQALNK
ncbi:MAG: PadR family transcriptional regulator [archaeon]